MGYKELGHEPHERRGKNPDKLSKTERASYRAFKERARGWMLTADAVDKCPKHWDVAYERFKHDEGFVTGAKPVGAKDLHGRYWNAVENGWSVYCTGEDDDGTLCQESVRVSVDAQGESEA